MRISTKDDLDKHSATLLMLVKQIMLLHSPRQYKLVLDTIFKETPILSKIDKPGLAVIVDFLEGNRPDSVESGSAEERFFKLVSDFESKIETFDETFYIESLQLCVEFARYGFLTLTDTLLIELNEKFVESKMQH
ncbi:hypothetical protein MHBO_003069 [Bonamia ostreae]|uniref:Uncharacterized protein n=1 Tax=Bonamia ostreae TaxID=126728 RepID=A0ABV2APD9_9EUKA